MIYPQRVLNICYYLQSISRRYLKLASIILIGSSVRYLLYSKALPTLTAFFYLIPIYKIITCGGD